MRLLTIATATLLVLLAGCASPSNHSEGSRAELYASFQQLASDSDLVAVVTAGGEAGVVDDPQPATGVEVKVDRVVQPSEGSVPDIVVWQLGTSKQPGPLPVMKPGERYLLFLIATGLNRGGYFITGSAAGFWTANGDGFTRSVDEGDDLPQDVTVAELEAALSSPVPQETEAPAAS